MKKYAMIYAAATALWMSCLTVVAGVKPADPHLELLVKATTLMHEIEKSNDLILVDIRNEKEFSRFKIPGAINVPVHFIPQKQFLKTSQVTLIHKGWANMTLLGYAASLNKKGFNIKVLDGGISAWQNKGGPLVGDPFAMEEIRTITSAEILRGQGTENWQFINLGPESTTNESILGKKVISLFPDNGPEISGRPVNRYLGATVIQPGQAFILFNQTGRDYERINEEISRRYRHRVFFLTGGAKSYKDFKRSLALANRPIGERTLEIGHCEPCKSNVPKQHIGD